MLFARLMLDFSRLCDIPLKAPVIATMCRGRLWNGHGIICGSYNLLRQRWENLLALRGMEGSDACWLGDCVADKGWAHGVSKW